MNFIHGYEKNLPPINPKDKGHIRYPIETAGAVIAAEGGVPSTCRNLPITRRAGTAKARPAGSP